MTSMSGNRDHPVAATASSAGGGAERCPRCGSHNTKFCYYNNYNLAQPRHFCKACRRYWTLGGTLRDVPIGGSTRTTPQRSKQPPSSRRRPLPAQAPAPTHASVSSSSASSPPVFNSLDSGSPSIASISIVPYTESTTSNVPGAMDDVGAFTPLLMEPPPAGFMALRGPFHHVFDGFSVDPGLAGSPVGTNGQLCFGMGTGAVSWPSFVDDGAAGVIGGGVAGAVHRDGEEASRVVAGGVELVGGDGSDCFWWPELATSPTSGERGGRQ